MGPAVAAAGLWDTSGPVGDRLGRTSAHERLQGYSEAVQLVTGLQQTWPAVRAMMAGGPPVVVLPKGVRPTVLRPSEPLDVEDAGAVLLTSGSSGTHRAVVLTRSAMRAAAEATAERLGDDSTTWTCALPTHFVAGFMVLVRSAVSGQEPFFADSDLSNLHHAPGQNAISIVGTQLYRALDDEAVLAKLRRIQHILVGGSAVDQSQLRWGRAAGLNLITTYGMSETCGGCIYDGVPLSGVEVSFRPVEHLPADQGQICLRGPQLFAGYRCDPKSTKDVLVDGWLLTNDRGRLIDGHLDVVGRLDEVVISGGVNIDLAQVRRAVQAVHPQTVVSSVPDGEWGELVVVADTSGRSVDAWREALSSELPRTWLPRAVAQVAELPLTDRGKIDREAVQRLFASEKAER